MAITVCLALAYCPLGYRSLQLVGLPDIGDPFDVEEFRKSLVLSDADNAAVEYREAALLSIKWSGSADIDDAIEAGWATTPKPVRKWLEDNRAALKVWRRGTEKPASHSCDPEDVGTYRAYASFSEHRRFSWLARLEAGRLLHNGDPSGAWGWLRAAFRHSRHFANDGCSWISRTTGAAYHSITSDAIVLWATSEHVDAAMLRQATNDIQADFRMTPAVSTTLKGEYAGTKSSLYDKELRRYILNDDLPLPRVRFFLSNEPELSRRVYQHIYANLLTKCDDPDAFHLRKTTSGLFQGPPTPISDLTPDQLEAHFEGSFLAAELMPSPQNLLTWVGWEKARHDCLLTTLTAQIHFREHGRFPENPRELLGSDLKKLPADPFDSHGNPIHYKLDPKTGNALVWSIGRDHKDDGGDIDYKPPGPPTDIGYHIRVRGK